MMLDHSPSLHAGRLADDADGHRNRHLLVAADGEEIDVEVPAPDVIALDLTGKREVLRAVDLEVDQHVGAGASVEEVEEILGVHRHGERPHAVPVQHGRHAAGRPKLARGSLAASFPLLRLELQLHGFPSSPRPPQRLAPASAANRTNGRSKPTGRGPSLRAGSRPGRSPKPTWPRIPPGGRWR